jgi:hypothetical protein
MLIPDEDFRLNMKSQIRVNLTIMFVLTHAGRPTGRVARSRIPVCTLITDPDMPFPLYESFAIYREENNIDSIKL